MLKLDMYVKRRQNSTYDGCMASTKEAGELGLYCSVNKIFNLRRDCVLLHTPSRLRLADTLWVSCVFCHDFHVAS